MFEMILFIIIIVAVIHKSKKKNSSPRQTPPFAAPHFPQKKPLSEAEVTKKMEASRQVPPKPAKVPSPPGRNAGKRYEDWLPVSKDNKIVRCTYCGAENQIPKRAKPGAYTCYFCREELL